MAKSLSVLKPYLLPVAVAAVMSYLSSRYIFVGSSKNLIPWGLLALSFGLLTPGKASAVKRGAVYGFFQSFIFLWVDKSGSTSLVQFLLLVVVISLLGVFGAGCGWLLARFGWMIRTLWVRKKAA